METKCIICDKLFSHKRTGARFCSPNCRQISVRRKEKEPVIQEPPRKLTLADMPRGMGFDARIKWLEDNDL